MDLNEIKSSVDHFYHTNVCGTLTVSGHPHHQTLLEAALLAAVPVDPHDGAALVLKALLVLDVLLDASTEKTLHTHRHTHTGMRTEGSRNGAAVSLCLYRAVCSCSVQTRASEADFFHSAPGGGLLSKQDTCRTFRI